MGKVLVVLFADALDQIGTRYEPPAQPDRPGLRVRLRIIDGDVDIDAPDGGPREALGHAQRLGRGKTAHVEPRLAVLSDRLDDEGVILPPADGIPHPGRL